MNSVVLLRQVPDPNLARSLLKVAPDGLALALPTSSVPVMNGYDANALEVALKLKEKRGGTLVSVSVGPDSCKDLLRRSLAMGVDQAIHIQGPIGPGNDSLALAGILAAAVRKIGDVDLVLGGRAASDTDAGVVPALVAGLLGWPVITPVRALSVGVSGSLVADRITERGVRRLEVRGSVVIGVSNEINKPRNPQLKGVAQAKRATIPTWTTQELGIAVTGSSPELRVLSVPPVTVGTPELISGSPVEAGRALADRLRHEGLI